MPIDSFWIELAVTVLGGAAAGGLTNHLAVWMLFHPYERRFGLHGAIPKNKERLARTIGRTVGERLLSPADLLGELQQGGVRAAFDERIAQLVAEMLETERGTLRQLLPGDTIARLQSGLTVLSESIASGVERYLDSDEFVEHARAFVGRVRGELSRQPIGKLVSVEQREELTRRAREWAHEVTHGPELERGIREYLARHSERVLSSGDPMLRRIPPAVLNAVEAAIENYLPLAAERLGAFLSHPASRDRLRDALRNLFQKFITDLEFHQRIIARLMVTERTFEKALDALERDGVEQLVALLEDDNVRAELIRTIREAVLAFLQKPVSEVVGDGGGDRTGALVQSAGDYLLRILRDERTHDYLLGRLRELVERSEHRTIGDVLAGVSDETVARWLVQGAATARARELLRDGIAAALSRSLDVRIGRPARWLPEDASTRISASLAPAVWEWLQNQLPAIIARVDLESMVERKVLGFSTQRMEEIIRGVTERELRLIVKLGYALGAVIGLLAFGITRLSG